MRKIKLFLSLLILALGIGNAWGETVTFTPSNCTNWTSSQAEQTQTIDGITLHSTGAANNTQLRLYSGATHTFTSTVGNITSIFFTCTANGTANYGPGKMSGDGYVASSAKTGEWTGNSATVTLTGGQSRCTSIVVTYTPSSSGGDEPEPVIVKTLESIAVSGMTTDYETGDVFKFDGTCTATYSVTKDDVAQADETAEVTPTTVSTPDMSTAGTKVITVTYTEDGVTVTDTYEIEVTQNEVTPGTYTGTLNNVFFGCAVGNNAAEQSGKFDDVLVVAGCKSSASSKTNYQSGHVRFYADSYLTLSVPTGYVIKSIVFTADGTWNGSITASAGTYTDGTKTWAGNAQEVKFSFAAQNRIESVKVTYAADVKYALNITTPSNGTLVVKDGSIVLADGAQVYEGTKLVVTPTPEAGFVFESLTVNGSAVELTDGTYTFNMPAANVIIAATFKENEKPAATLTLSKNGVEETFPGSWKQDDKVTLPSITSECVKEFVGWSANPTCNVAPEYAAGDSYTLAATAQTLCAVYATVGGGETLTITPSAVDNDAENDIHTFTIDAAGYSLTAKKNSGSSAPTINASAKDVRIYAKGTITLTAPKAIGTIVFNLSAQGKQRLAPITASVGTIAPQASGDAIVTWTGDATEVTFTVGDKADFGSDGSSKGGQLCFSTITVTTVGSYSNYSTTCVAALDEPEFSVEGGENEAKTITLTATEGTIYYTLDTSTPTALSEKYTTPIVLDECGEYTIKAIAISSDSESPVASATYQIQLPILANSETDPYTEAEAVEVFNGGCYDGAELVYVKGTVKTATFYSSGTYTITLTNGFQFYKFYKSATKELFTDGAINAGDVLVACGKLSKYNTTYQLAEGCYLVAHEPYTEPKVDISNDEASAYTVDKAFELIADVKSDLTKEVYVKGLVAVAPTSNPTADGQMTYSISDNGVNTGNVLKVYLGLNLNGEKFTSKNDVQQGDYVVVKGKLLDYNSTYELNKGNQLVQHVKAATIKIADITMEVGETKTIEATITPDAAQSTVQYAITSGNEYITLEGTTITAVAAGTATITATIAEKANEYKGATKTFTVTVTPQNIATLPFAFDGKCADIATTAGMSQEGIDVDDYASSPHLKINTTGDYLTIHFDSEPGALSYTIKANVNSGDFTGGFDVQVSENGDDYDVLVSYTELEKTAAQKTHKLDKNVRYVKFVYTNKVSGQNVALGNILISKLSVLRADLYDGKWGTFCPDKKVTYMQGASFYTLTYLEMKDGMPYKLFFDEITTDYLEAGKPYLFIAEGEEIKGVKSGEVVSIASNYNGFYGNVSGNTISLTTTQTEYVADGDVVNNYGVINSRFTLLGNGTNVAHERAHVQIKNGQLDCPNPPASLPALAPGARRVVAGATGINTATGVDQVQGDNVPTKMIINGQLFILRGEKMYDAQGKLVK